MTAKVEKFRVTCDALTKGIYEVEGTYVPPEDFDPGYVEVKGGQRYIFDGGFERTAAKAREIALQMVRNAVRQEQSVIADAQSKIAKLRSLEF